jgi:acyl transferase domain-containing protein/surfactin synthase thioesterase subunit/NADP-dependent 3-hydroxy acid dehydrogenase YdfG/aryl carrier-like protein
VGTGFTSPHVTAADDGANPDLTARANGVAEPVSGLNRRLRPKRQAMREPIAIVGMGCRFPGDVDSPAALAALLREKRSAIREVPADRWDGSAFFHPDFKKPGSIHVRRLGLLSNVDRFDAGFFGISPNEAKRMDPQQRHVLETSYLAIEDAGVPLEHLAGKNVAVIVGAGASDYGAIVRGATERANIAATSNPGSALSIVSNRVSYLFDLRGPSFTVDTACSSSLTALHYACESIWSGVSVAAIAAGANSVLSPEITMGFSKGGYLSPDAECRAFSDHANGYVRSEGAAAVFLKPLSAALADRDRIYAVIRGTWINQDGRTSGMTVPSVAAQEELLRSALRVADVDPSRISYVEAHGTGTPAGDPIEANAIGNVVGRSSGRTDSCFIGSVKTNLGHMECCAGMGGLIKLALVLEQRQILPNIHFRRANPAIDLDALGLQVATEVVDLPRSGPVFGGVNSFGFGGANGHAVLETAPEVARRSSSVVPATLDVAEPLPFLVSARSAAALASSALRLADQLERQCDEVPDLHALAAALRFRRSRFEHRLGLVASSRDELRLQLTAFGKTGQAPTGGVIARAPEAAKRCAFVYTGQGAQWFAMGRKLLESHATFQDAIDEIGAELARLGWQAGVPGALRAELTRSQTTSRMGETRIAQPCIFALQVALGRILAERGVRPSAVVGHSIGELAAAVTAGALTQSEATRIVYWRSECQAAAEGKGAMIAIGLGERDAQALLGARRDIEIAAFNGPSSLTLAGSHEAADEILAELEERGTFVRRLDVSVPFHCHLMDPIETDFRARLGSVTTTLSSLPFYSTVTGAPRSAPLDIDYWYDNIRQPVRYEQALRAMLADGIDCFVEIGPHPALHHGSVETIREAGSRSTWVPTLRRDGDDARGLAAVEAQLFAVGVREDIEHTGGAEHVSLPPYPLVPERYWLETEAGRRARVLPVAVVHPHLGKLERGVHSPDVFSVELRLDPRVETYVGDHRAQGHIVFPAAGQLELVIAAARHVYATDAFEVEELEFRRPIVLVADETELAVHRLDIYSDDGSFLVLSSSGKPDAPWIEHTKGRIRRSRHPVREDVDVEALRARVNVDIPQAAFYRACGSVGLELGASFKNLQVFRHDGERKEFLCRVEPIGLPHADVARFFLHPALLDATIHSMLPVDAERTSQQLFLPFHVERVRFLGTPPESGRFWSHARVRWATNDEFATDMDLFDDDGRPFARFEGLIARLVRGSTTDHPATAVLYDHDWQRAPREVAAARRQDGKTWLVFGSVESPEATRLVEQRLSGMGARVVRVFSGERCLQIEPGIYEIRSWIRDDFDALVESVGGKVAGVVLLCSLDTPDGSGVVAAARQGVVPASHLVSALSARNTWLPDSEVWIVTALARATHHATLWGFGRVLMSERPKLTVTLVDLGSPSDNDAVAALGAELERGPEEAEIALRGAERWKRTLARHAVIGLERPFDVARHALRQVVRSPGIVDSIALEEFHVPELGDDDVEVSVRAVGLNFRDVVAAMNLLPKEAWEGGLITGHQLGLDAAGIVTRVGRAVTHVGPGDSVVGFFPHSLATRAVTKARQLAKLLPGLSMSDAAALPTPFTTADIGLRDLARLEAGETVLIHAGAGGVGTVAVQIALEIGATVIATTSSEEKRAFLRDLGVHHVFGSRTADFGDEILELTKGEGVDVVLNSLSGLAMTESFRCLRPFGRFVEIGKTDIYRNRQVGLRQFGENKSWFCLDINRLYLRPKMDVVARLVRAMEARTNGAIRSLPVRTFPLAESASALRTLGQGKQIGRIVVEVPEQGELVASRSREVRFDAERVQLVTGGCTGFGLALAEWLVEKGARELVLAGRRGVPSGEEERKVEALRARGARVSVFRADVSERAQVDDLIAQARALGPLGGVFHAAMVLDDGAIDTLDEERFGRVLAPKAEGARHLHEATKDLVLDHFVLFSSIASVLGTPGQASYAAANAYLDELAARRRATGLSATSINWGVIEDVGIVARAPASQKRKILGQGIRAMSSRRAFELLEQVLCEGRVSCTIADLDRRLLARLGGSSRRFEAELLGLGDSLADAKTGDSLRETLASAEAADRVGILVTALSTLLSSVAGLGAERVDIDTSLGRYGLDSLMIAQLQTWIDEQLGLSVAMVRLMRGPSITELASELVAELAKAGARGSTSTGLIRRLKEVASPRLRVVCFPPMAMDVDVFASLAEALPSDVAVDAVSLPTFEDPDTELLHLTHDEQTARLIEAMDLRSDEPFVLYGHSMGAYVALAVARALAAQGGPMPALVGLGAVPTPMPAMAEIRDPVDITEAMAEEAIRRFDATATLSPAERARILLLARRDLWITARGPHADASAPPGRSFLVTGSGDPLTTIDKTPAFGDLGYEPPRSVPGGHLFLFDREACRELAKRLCELDAV